MSSFYREVLHALDTDGGALVSIVEASGSAPRGVGAKMLVRADGSMTGTIGGGAVEYAAGGLAAEAARERRSLYRRYDLSAGEISELGMVCGGSIAVYIQYLDSADARLRALYAAIADCRERFRRCALVTVLREERCDYYLDAADSPAPPPADIGDTGELRVFERDGARVIIEPLVSGERVLLFGAGHVGRELSFFLRRLGFYHIVVDDRAEFLTERNLPDADRRERMDFTGAVEAFAATDRDYIVIMTRGHLNDYTVLRDALRTPARYIGMIGSRGKIATSFGNLRKEGFADADIARVKAPIGLPLGGRTPEEVALSVAAELVRARSGYTEK